MRILLLNDSYFSDSLRKLGHDVFLAGPAEAADFKVGLEPVHVGDILDRCPFVPDFMLLTDSINLRTAFLGLEAVEIPKVFYGVDSPMNAFWQFHMANVFDLTFFDQNSSVKDFRAKYPHRADRVDWLPLAADQNIYHRLNLEKLYDVSFVGSLNERVRPKRTWLLRELSRHFRLQVFDGSGTRTIPPGEVAKIYNQSRVVLNENLFPGLNLRAFEIMACGACLLTESSDGSWKQFFNDWEHLVAFESENVIERLHVLLRDDQQRDYIADAGLAQVLANHTIEHRAGQLVASVKDYLHECELRGDANNSHYLGRAFLQLADRHPGQPVGKLKPEGFRLLMAAAASDVESATPHFELAAQSLQEGRLPDARASLQCALEIDPGHLRSRWALFWCLKEIGEAAAAGCELERFCHHLRKSCNDRQLFQRVSEAGNLEMADYLFFAELLECAGWLMEPGVDRLASHPCRWMAFDALQKAITLSPQTGTAYVTCAKLLERYQSFDFAAILLEKAAQLRPWDESLDIELATLLLRSYRRPEGLNRLVDYLLRSPDADKWEEVEKLRLTESERRYILDRVWNTSRKSEAAIRPSFAHRVTGKLSRSRANGDQPERGPTA
jgi:tetratricopeptide (TPR) repeat protein